MMASLWSKTHKTWCWKGILEIIQCCRSILTMWRGDMQSKQFRNSPSIIVADTLNPATHILPLGVCVHVCAHMLMCVCIHACLFVYLFICVHTCLSVCVRVYTCACACVCVDVCTLKGIRYFALSLLISFFWVRVSTEPGSRQGTRNPQWSLSPTVLGLQTYIAM